MIPPRIQSAIEELEGQRDEIGKLALGLRAVLPLPKSALEAAAAECDRQSAELAGLIEQLRDLDPVKGKGKSAPGEKKRPEPKPERRQVPAPPGGRRKGWSRAPISDEKRAAILKLRQEGVSNTDIARRCAVSVHTVTRVAVAAGAPKLKPGPKPAPPERKAPSPVRAAAAPAKKVAAAPAGKVGLVEKPGRPGSPCANEALCTHDRCERLRAIAGTQCPGCPYPIGYATPYVRDGERVWHARCRGAA